MEVMRYGIIRGEKKDTGLNLKAFLVPVFYNVFVV